MSTCDSSARSPRPSLIDTRSAYFAHGECVAGTGLYFGDAPVYAIHQLDIRRYRLHFSPDDNGILVSSALMLVQREG